jgi:cytochrome c oxidase subunit 2
MIFGSSAKRIAVLAGVVLMAGCESNRFQSALDPAGPQALEIWKDGARLLWICIAAYVVTMLFLLVAVARSRSDRDLGADPVRHRRMTRVVAGGTVVTVALLLALLIGSLFSSRRLASLATSDAEVSINATGHQWWWDFEYEHPQPSKRFHSPNEIHIPVGRTVRVHLRSSDVIHSFWIPNLAGKKDLIPGHETALYLRADRPGTFRGQCAEFCGLQHSHMSFVVVAESPESYSAWAERQRASAAEPANEAQQRGREVFLRGTCAMCHAIGGTPAAARFAPDLTHVAGRRTLAAGTLPNTVGNMAGWIVNPQSVKPGNHMPANSLAAADLQDLLAYLRSLQ